MKQFVITATGQSSRKAFYAAQREHEGLLTKTVFETAKFDGAPGGETVEAQAERLMSKAGGKFEGITAPAGCFYVEQPTETTDGKFVFFGSYTEEQVTEAKARIAAKAKPEAAPAEPAPAPTKATAPKTVKVTKPEAKPEATKAPAKKAKKSKKPRAVKGSKTAAALAAAE